MTAFVATLASNAAGNGLPAPSYTFNFLTSGNTLPSGVTLTRGSAGTYTDQNGYLQSVGNDVARFDWRFNPAGTPIPLGLLIEPSATQLLAHTDDVTNAVWGKNGGLTVTAAQATGPDGTKSMASMVNSTSTFNELYQPITLTGGQAYAISAYVKYGTGDQYIVQQLTQLGGLYGAASFQILKGLLGYGFVNGFTVNYATLEQLQNNIFRIVTVVTPAANQNSNVGLYLQTINPGSAFQASAGSTSYICNIMCETAFNGNQYTSYFPNAATGTATRSADTVTLTMANATYDILVEDAEGGEFRQSVVIGAGSYALSPRTGKRHVTRVRAWTHGTLTAAQITALTPPDNSAPILPPTLAPAAGTTPSPSPSPSPSPTPTPTGNSGHDKTAQGWTLTFLDDFDGVVDTDGQLYFDRTKWTPGFFPVTFGQDNGGDGSRYLSGNVEQQLYVDKDYSALGRVPANRVINPFSIQNSVLRIETGIIPDDLQGPYWVGDIRQFYSGMLSSCVHFSQLYGLFEIRAKWANGPGAWPAFWFLRQESNTDPNSPDGPHWPPEGDCLEQFTRIRPNQSHWGAIYAWPGGGYGDWVNMPSGSPSTDFHVYSWQWGANFLTYFIDGVQVAQVATPSNFNMPMYILTNVAVGGEWYRGEANAIGDPTGGGSGDYMTLVNYAKNTPGAVPYYSYIDWIRAYKRTDGTTNY